MKYPDGCPPPMADSWRITVKGDDSDKLEAFKEAHYKKLYQGSGDQIIFEVPTEEEADAVIEAAKAEGLEASKEAYEDPLGDAEAVDFW